MEEEWAIICQPFWTTHYRINADQYCIIFTISPIQQINSLCMESLVESMQYAMGQQAGYCQFF